MSTSKSFELPPDFDQIDRVLFHNLQVAHNNACILPLVRALRKAGLRKVSDWTAPKAWAMLRPHFIGDAPTLEASIMMQGLWSWYVVQKTRKPRPSVGTGKILLDGKGPPLTRARPASCVCSFKSELAAGFFDGRQYCDRCPDCPFSSTPPNSPLRTETDFTPLDTATSAALLFPTPAASEPDSPPSTPPNSILDAPRRPTTRSNAHSPDSPTPGPSTPRVHWSSDPPIRFSTPLSQSVSSAVLVGWKGKKRIREAESEKEAQEDEEATDKEVEMEMYREGTSKNLIDGPCVELWVEEKRKLAQQGKTLKEKDWMRDGARNGEALHSAGQNADGVREKRQVKRRRHH